MVHQRTPAQHRKQVVNDLKSVLPPETFNLSIELSARLVGMSYGHARDLVRSDKFPVRVITFGDTRRFVTLTDLADYLANQMEKAGGAK